VEYTPSAEPEEEIAVAPLGESGEDATSVGDQVEEDMPGGQFVEKPAPVSAGFWAMLKKDNFDRIDSLEKGENRKSDCKA
jgi:hypothetical protein